MDGLADISAELPRHRRIRFNGENRHSSAPAGRISIGNPLGAHVRRGEPVLLAPMGVSFLGIRAGGWAAAAGLYAVIGAAALVSWTMLPLAPWPDGIPVFHVVFETPAEPSALGTAAPLGEPPVVAPPTASAPTLPADAEPPLASTSVAETPPLPPPKPHPQPRRAPSPPAQLVLPAAPVAPSETQVAAGTTVMPVPPLAPSRDAAYVPPRPIGACEPIYPAEAKQHGLQGRLLLHLEISTDGTVSASVKSSSGHAVLDNAALAKARACRFAPATRDGVAVVGSVERPINFRLED